VTGPFFVGRVGNADDAGGTDVRGGMDGINPMNIPLATTFPARRREAETGGRGTDQASNHDGVLTPVLPARAIEADEYHVGV
jgi:hypothetical protein